MKKVFIGILILILIGGLVAASIYFYKTRVDIQRHSGIEAIPKEASVLFEIKDAQHSWDALYNTMMWHDLMGSKGISSLTHKIAHIDSMLLYDVNVRKSIKRHRTFIACFPSASKELDLLYIFEKEDNLSLTYLKGWIPKATSYTQPLKERVFNKQQLYTIVDGARKDVFTFTLIDNLLIGSSNGGLVEDAVRTLKKPLAEKMQRLKKVRTLASQNVDLNIYVNYTALNKFFGLFTNKSYPKVLHGIAHFADWSSYDVRIGRESVLFTGISSSKEASYLELFQDQQPQKPTILDVLPRNVGFMMHYGLSHPEKFHQDFLTYTNTVGEYQTYQALKDTLIRYSGVSPDQWLSGSWGKEVALAVLESGGKDIGKGLLIAFDCASIDSAVQSLSSVAKVLQEKWPGGDKETGSTYKKYVIRYLPSAQFLQYAMGGPFSGIGGMYFTNAKGKLLLASSISILKQTLDAIDSRLTLANDSRYQTYAQGLTPKSNLYFFINTPKALQIPQKYVSPVMLTTLNEEQYYFKKFEYLSLQISRSPEKYFYTDISFKYNPIFTEETRLIWKADLDTTISMIPKVVFNSVTEKSQVLIQDDARRLMMFDNTGIVQWQKQLSNPILGDIHEIDLFSNGQTQYLFNTESMVYLVDQAGGHVLNYPIRLETKAISGLALFHTSKSKEYSYFIPTEQQQLFGYSGTGKPLTGWSPAEVKLPTNKSLDFIKHKGVNYAYTTSIDHQLLLWQLNGEAVKTPAFGSDSVAMVSAYSYVNKDSSSGYFYGLDSLGSIWRWAIGDSTAKTLGARLLGGANKFWAQDIDHDLRVEFIAGTDSTVYIYNNGQEQGSILFQEPVNYKPIQLPDGKWAISLCRKRTDQVYLYDIKGSLFEAFPLKGATFFEVTDFYRDESKHFITGSNRKQLLLYKVK